MRRKSEKMRKNNLEICEHVDAWLHFCARTYSTRTTEAYSGTINQLLRFLSANELSFSTETVEAWLDYKLENGASRSSWNSWLVHIRSFCAWRKKRYGVPSVVHGKITRIRQDPPHRRMITKKEYGMLLAATSGISNDIIRFLANTGIRKDEFRRLTWGAMKKDRLHIVGKGRKFRVVPLNSSARTVISHYLRGDDDDPFPPSILYESREGCSFLIRKTCRRIGIERAGSHSCRRFFATQCPENGMPMPVLQRILGHSDISTTMQYVRLSDEALIGATECLVG
ncbi:MAG: tyrosine-type recombinase/integrase [Phycisphaerae bacterium]|nr:tyrosine-type recombinase/integrase [Phycisphaerae bacterium]